MTNQLVSLIYSTRYREETHVRPKLGEPLFYIVEKTGGSSAILKIFRLRQHKTKIMQKKTLCGSTLLIDVSNLNRRDDSYMYILFTRSLSLTT